MGRSKVLNFGFSSSKLGSDGVSVTAVKIVNPCCGVSGTDVVGFGDKSVVDSDFSNAVTVTVWGIVANGVESTFAFDVDVHVPPVLVCSLRVDRLGLLCQLVHPFS